MVNIVSIVAINEETVQTYSGFDSWWQAIHGNSSAKNRSNQIEYRRRRDNFAVALSAKYHIPIQRLTNVGFLFASLTQVKQEFEDYETRTMICDQNSRIIIQNKAIGDQLTVITIVHNITTFKTFITSAPLGKTVLQATREEE